MISDWWSVKKHTLESGAATRATRGGEKTLMKRGEHRSHASYKDSGKRAGSQTGGKMCRTYGTGDSTAFFPSPYGPSFRLPRLRRSRFHLSVIEARGRQC